MKYDSKNLTSRKQGVSYLFRTFETWTTVHGLPHIGLSKPFWVKSIWFLVTGVVAGGFLYQLIFQLIRTYFNWPVNVDTTRPFPAVTFCFLNPWKITKIAGTPLEDLVDAYVYDDVNEQYGFVSPMNTQRVQRAIKWTQFMYEELVQLDSNYSLSYSFDDLFISCSYDGNSCNSSDFKEFYDPFYGRCFTFNNDGHYMSTRASPNYGLRTIIRVNLIEFLPWTTSAGVTVYVHNSGESPLIDTLGYFLPVTKSSSLGVRAMARKKLPKPYSKCINKVTRSQVNYYDSDYNIEFCLRSCMQEKIIESCGCYDPSFAKPSDDSVVSCYNTSDPNSAIDCIWTLTNFDGSATFNVYEECNCPMDDQVYRVTMSNAYWPMKKYDPDECVLDAYYPNRYSDYAEWNKIRPTGLPTFNRGNKTKATKPPKTTLSSNQTTTARSACLYCCNLNKDPAKCWWCDDCSAYMVSTTTTTMTPTNGTKTTTTSKITTNRSNTATSSGTQATETTSQETMKPVVTTTTKTTAKSSTRPTPPTPPHSGSNSPPPPPLAGKDRKKRNANATHTPTPTANVQSTIANCKGWYSENTLVAEVYYERMDWQTKTETPAYPLLNLISDIGGQIGFWLGMSMISVIEIFFFLLVCLCYMMFPKKVRPCMQSLGMKPHNIAPLDKTLDKKNSELGLHRPENLYDDKHFDIGPPPPYQPYKSGSDGYRPESPDSMIFDWQLKGYNPRF